MESLPARAPFDLQTKRHVEEWLQGAYDEETKNAVRKLLLTDPQRVADSFYTRLRFGTGGMRGLVGLGTNRMNEYTVRAATQGLAQHLIKQAEEGKPLSVVIGYDSRSHSREFAEEAACVLAGNGIRALLFEALRPTPLVSFACRRLGCSAAIMITASHNPPEYNGYKVYWKEGGQVLPPHDKAIIDEIELVDSPASVKRAGKEHPLIEKLAEQIDRDYLDAIADLQLTPQLNQEEGESLHIVYTNLHGTGITLIPQAMAMWGFTNITYVKEQQRPDGSFPTISTPNPEDPKALKLGIELLLERQADLLLANDPDGDRIGAAVRRGEEALLLDGHQIACLSLEHLCSALKREGRIPEGAACIKTYVTSDLFRAIAERYGIACFETLPGFKYIAQLMETWEKEKSGPRFLFGAEESHGYLFGSHAHDKDGIISCALLAEAALNAKKEGKTLYDKLLELYLDYGVYREKLRALQFEESKEGKEKMSEAMRRLREEPPASLLGTKAVWIVDYLTSSKTSLQSGKREPIQAPQADLMAILLADESKLLVRPSGTEPKVKIYSQTRKKPAQGIELSLEIEHCDTLAEEYGEALANHLQKSAL